MSFLRASLFLAPSLFLGACTVDIGRLFANAAAESESFQESARAPAPEKTLFAGPAQGQIISLVSESPFGVYDILQKTKAETVVLGAALAIPRTEEIKKPAMILLHGSGGPGAKGARYARILNEMGIATLRLDSFTGRGVSSTTGRQSLVTEAMMTTDAIRALAFLAAHPDIDPKRVGIMGWSKGGGIALLTALEEVNSRVMEKTPMRETIRFAAHLAFYPPCFVDVSAHQPTGAPIAILIGEKDRWTPPKPCAAFARQFRANGAAVSLEIYAEAEHDFDSSKPLTEYPNGYNYAGCRFALAKDGQLRDRSSGLPLTSAEDFQNAVSACATKGAWAGRNAEAAERALLSMKRFLQDTLVDF